MKKYAANYKVKKLDNDTYAIVESGTGIGTVYMYLLVGAEKALLIDSGYGLLDLKAILRTITDKEIICVITHGHIDHALGARQFEHSYMHSLDQETFRRHTSPDLIGMVGEKGIMMKPKPRKLANESYRELIREMQRHEYPLPDPIEEVQSFDLGGRIITWRHFPGHTPGSISLLDSKNHTVFDSDCAPFGLFLFLPESLPMQEYISGLRSYVHYLQNEKVNRRYIGHAARPLKIKSTIKLLKCCRVALEHPNRGRTIKTTLGTGRMIFSHGSMIVCRR